MDHASRVRRSGEVEAEGGGAVEGRGGTRRQVGDLCQERRRRISAPSRNAETTFHKIVREETTNLQD